MTHEKISISLIIRQIKIKYYYLISVRMATLNKTTLCDDLDGWEGEWEGDSRKRGHIHTHTHTHTHIYS